MVPASEPTRLTLVRVFRMSSVSQGRPLFLTTANIFNSLPIFIFIIGLKVNLDELNVIGVLKMSVRQSYSRRQLLFHELICMQILRL